MLYGRKLGLTNFYYSEILTGYFVGFCAIFSTKKIKFLKISDGMKFEKRFWVEESKYKILNNFKLNAL
jgi:hypothetical protein